MQFYKKKNLKNYQSGNKVTLIKTGAEYFSNLDKIIETAKDTIHLQTYILSDDKTGQKIISALKEASRRGVNVYVLIDTYGSLGLSSAFTEEIKNAGIHFRYFAPLISSKGFRFGRRLHQKVVVADSRIALIGGINIADRYNQGADGNLPWLDFAVLIEGPVSQNIADICARFWGRKFSRNKKKINRKTETKYPLVEIAQNDWLRKKSQISKSYRNAFRAAEKKITIVGAYFMPSRKLRKLIKRAVERGVEVKIIVSKKSDEIFFRLAMNYLYGWLIKNGVQIYEYVPAIVHGKAAVVDGQWLSVGSHDLNFLSTYGLVEMNVNVFDRDLVREFENHLEEKIEPDSDRITRVDLDKKWIFEKFLSFLAYNLMRLSLWLLIFVFTPRFSQGAAERD